MIVEPSEQAFADDYARGAPQVVWTTLVSDLETPVSAFMKIAAGRPMSFLLESVEGGAARGRYSILGLDPDVIWRCKDGRAEINRNARNDAEAFVPLGGNPLDTLRAFVTESRIDWPAALPPAAAGVFGYLGYEMVRLMEDLPAPKPDWLGVPDSIMMRPSIIVVFDSVRDQMTLVTPVWPTEGVSAAAALARAREHLEDIIAALDVPLDKQPAAEAGAIEVPPVSNTTPDEFKAMVARAKEYIFAGDIFQVVLSQRFEVPFTLPPFALYRAIRRVNPSPYLFFLDFGTHAVIGSSPEILVRVAGGAVTVRPIAGTRARGLSPHEDKALEDELLADPKERAEHLMLLDLGRNDVGRVATIGSVKVTDQFFVERYSHVMHIVSNVEGRLAEGKDGIEALSAGFPAGTVSGAPKVRAMEIIDELEKDRRSIYAGCVGYFSAAGDMDSCIVLRTAIVKDGKLYAQAGAGIVADSDPDSEQQECINKAKAVIRAAEEARRFASSVGHGQ